MPDTKKKTTLEKDRQKQRNKFIEKVKETINLGTTICEPTNQIDFFKLFMKAGEVNQLHRIFGCNTAMFKYCDDMLLVVFSIPTKDSKDEVKQNVSERIMDIVRDIELTLVNTESLEVFEVKEDKCSYVVILKKIKEIEELEDD